MYQVLKSYSNYKGGVNNLHIATVVDSRWNPIKVFTGTACEQRAERFAKKLEQ